MADIIFGSDGHVTFPTKYHGDVTLSKAKWAKICSQPERLYYKYNGDKVSTTLIAPDYVRYNRTIPTQFMYYKAFDTFQISDTVDTTFPCKFMTVIIDTQTERVCTVYPVAKPKLGKEYKPSSDS